MSDIADLFNLNPLEHTNETIDAIVADMRKRRGQFNLGNMSAGRTKPKAKSEKQMELDNLLKGNLELKSKL